MSIMDTGYREFRRDKEGKLQRIYSGRIYKTFTRFREGIGLSNFYINPNDKCEFDYDEKTGDYHGCFQNEKGCWVLCEKYYKQVIYELTGKHWYDIPEG